MCLRYPPRPLSSLARFLSSPPPASDIYPLSLHDALPISPAAMSSDAAHRWASRPTDRALAAGSPIHAGNQGTRQYGPRPEEHTSELESRPRIVCRLLLDQKDSGLDSRSLGDARRMPRLHT